jgi:hypothetical protein
MYLPEMTGEYLNACTGKYLVIPVSVFLMILYNACFMFQQDKTDNRLIKVLERFTLTPNLEDEMFFTTLSKWNHQTIYSDSEYFAKNFKHQLLSLTFSGY